MFKNDLYAKGGKECLCTANSMDLMGKPFVIFEELPVMNKNEWNVCDGKLKDTVRDKSKCTPTFFLISPGIPSAIEHCLS
ncbi:hypothetical protein EON65_27850 [archaeon]|nr:MAG: hypothetical protein EON65_27850 [archaeon]